MISVEETLEIAGRHHAAGKLPQAEKLYHQVLEREPHNPDAIHALGAMALQQGSIDKALELLGLASSLRPDDPEILSSLGAAYLRSNELDQAETCLERAVAVDPRRAESLCALADLQHAKGDADKAIELLKRAIEVDPRCHTALFNLGNLLAGQGHSEPALRCYAKALELDPDDWQAACNMGLVFKGEGAYEQAEDCLERAAMLDPGNAVIDINRSSLMLDTGRFAEAEKLCKQVSALIPKNPIPLNNMGLALLGQGRPADATVAFLKALTFDKQSPDVNLNLGHALRRQGKLDQAVGAYSRCLEHVPDHAPAALALATAELSLGKLEQGFTRLAERRAIPFFALRVASFDAPLWDGGPLEGKRILVYPEGDNRETIVLLRCARLLSDRGARVVLGCPPVLEPLARSVEGVDEVHLPSDPLPEIDLHASLDHAARFLLPDVASIPKPPYLDVDQARSERWDKRFAGIEGRKVGLMWRCDGEAEDPFENVPLEELEQLLDVEGIHWCGLQYELPDDDAKRLEETGKINDLTGEIEDLADALACVASLDLLISTDSLTLHLAGAAGIPAWALVSNSPEWWWMAEGKTTPWYPELRLFRRAEHGSWGETLARVRVALGQQG